MTEPRKKRRRSRGGGGSGIAPAAITTDTPASNAVIARSLPVWRWRTFPVYFALTGGMFLGVYLGILASTIRYDNGNETPTTVVLIISALAFGFGLSRMTSRFLVTRGFFKPKVRK